MLVAFFETCRWYFQSHISQGLKRLLHRLRFIMGFSRTEANAYLVLLLLLALVHLLADKIPEFYTDPEPPEQLDSLVMAWYLQSEGTAGSESTYHSNDPWDATGDSTNLKLTEKQKVSDSQSGNKQNRSVKPRAQRQSAPIADLNSVDSVWLKKIYGIGPVLSQRIVKYRDLLGGFCSLDQLNEVYNLPEETITTLKARVYLDLDKNPVKKLDLNQSVTVTLAQHPYISFKLANAIVAYRKQHGPYQSAEDLKRIHLVDDSTYLRVRPYLDF